MTGVRGPDDDSTSVRCFIIQGIKTIILVPISDAHKNNLKLPDNAKNVVEDFPRFSGTVPQDSVVLACFTTSKYMKNSDIYASFNIQWAAVLCGEDA
jgi:hypothetical protein